MKTENPMRAVKIEKVLLSSGATGDNLVKAKKLLEFVSGAKAQILSSTKRIPEFDVRPGLEVGTRVTLRGEKAIDLLKRLLGAIDNELSKKNISENHFSFGLKEYIEIPGIEYQRDIGIRGFNVTIVFARAGLRVKRKKIKRGDVPKKQSISKEEIMTFMKEAFKTKFK
jgi:large subunit ribosomal protein L5